MTDVAAGSLTVAFEHHRAGRLEVAEPLYRQFVVAHPDSADALHLLGALCLQTGRASEAIEHISRAIAINPTNPEYLNHLGAAYGSLRLHDKAVAKLRGAVQLAPQSATSHYNLGTALVNQGRLEQAVVSFRHALAVNPNWAEPSYNLGNTLSELKRPAEAEAAYRDALRAKPGYVKALVNLGNVLRDQERIDEAVETLHAAVTLDPNYANAHLNLGTAQRDAGEFDEAIESLERAVALRPDMAEAHNNLGTALQAKARYDEASAHYEEALRLDPNLADAHFSHATHRLRQGDIAGGFAEYEWRWKCKSYASGNFAEPRWDGGLLDGRAPILLHAEQGLGDTLQFIRYAAAVKQRGGNVVVTAPSALEKILAGVDGIDRFVPTGSQLPRFDVHCPMMSLPGALGLAMDQLAGEPYLHAQPDLVAQWRAMLAQYPGFRVGICWQGNRKHLFDAQRSVALERFATLARLDGVRLVSLQKGPGAEQVAQCPFAVVDFTVQFDATAGPFVDTAAVIKSVDLVITTDTSVAHLAGGLGAPVWVPLSAHADWRWFMGRDDSPWYPTMRLFRQRKLDEWDDVFARIAAALSELVSARDPSRRQDAT